MRVGKTPVCPCRLPHSRRRPHQILQADGPLQAATYTGQTQFRADDYYVFVVPRNGTAKVEGPSCIKQWPTGDNSWRSLSEINPLSAPAVVLLRASDCGDYSESLGSDSGTGPVLWEPAGPAAARLSAPARVSSSA